MICVEMLWCPELSNKIAAEEECIIPESLRLMDEGRIDIMQIDVTRLGLTQTMKIADLAHCREIPGCNHNFTTGINTAASRHFLSAIPNTKVYARKRPWSSRRSIPKALNGCLSMGKSSLNTEDLREIGRGGFFDGQPRCR